MLFHLYAVRRKRYSTENWKTFRIFCCVLHLSGKNLESAPYSTKSPPDNGVLNLHTFPHREVSMKITTVSVCVVCGILPLMILPVLPDTWILAVLFCLACLLCLIPHHYARYAALTLLFFMWGYLPPGRPSGRETSCPPRRRRRQSSLLPPII